jgi:TP53 regulating kinase-like protein
MRKGKFLPELIAPCGMNCGVCVAFFGYTLEGKKRKHVCTTIGSAIGRLHKNGIIHGDLTTSNMILDPEERIVFVDFGLGEKTDDLEAKAVDLHLMKRALQSTHYRVAQYCFNAVMDGYSSIIGLEKTKEVLGKIEEIERRGRYVADRKM